MVECIPNLVYATVSSHTVYLLQVDCTTLIIAYLSPLAVCTVLFLTCLHTRSEVNENLKVLERIF